MPRVSVLIPTYMPSRRYLVECLAGLDAQTYRDFEVVIVDESDEETAAFISAQPTSFPLRLVRPESRLGLAASLRHGVEVCEGEFIARHDADDICYPERVAEQVAFLSDRPEVDAVGSWVTKINENSEVLGLRKFPVTADNVRRESGFWNPMCHPAIMLRRSFFEKYGTYSLDVNNEDNELWLRALKLGAVMVNLPKPLIYYRIASNEGYSRPRFWGEVFLLHLKYASWDHLPTRIAGLVLTGLAAITPQIVFRFAYRIFNRLR